MANPQPTANQSGGGATVSPPGYSSKSETAVSDAIAYLESGTTIDPTALAVINELILALVSHLYQKK
jgi:hypothetical protein